MARYMVSYTQKHTGKVCESDIFHSYEGAFADAMYIHKLDIAKSIVILEDKEGEDSICNAGKFFLYRIIK